MPTTKSKDTRVKLRRRTKRKLVWGAAVAAGTIVFLSFYLYASTRPGQFVKSLGNDHLKSAEDKHVSYNSVPPTSGPHMPVIARGASTPSRFRTSSRSTTSRRAESSSSTTAPGSAPTSWQSFVPSSSATTPR